MVTLFKFLNSNQEMGWDYEEVDVSEFLQQEFSPGCRVDFLPVDPEQGSDWRRGTVLEQRLEDETRGILYWRVRCDRTRAQRRCQVT